MSNSINIDFPFSNNPTGEFLNLNKTSNDAIKADLMHLILTNKGERLYMPDFGTNLKKYIFGQNDLISYDEIKEELINSVNSSIPNLKISKLLVDASDEDDYTAIINLQYIISDGVFETNDSLTIKI